MVEPVKEPITGREEPIDPATPTGALAEFYRAFNRRDLRLMEANWHADDEASMDNPLGGIRRGWDDIRTVYERIFTGKARVAIEFYDYTIHQFTDAFLAVGRERGTTRIGETSLDLQIRTSRFFRRADGRWRQVHHHGSIEDAPLLGRYQAAVR
jgi:ketosteroid isomerase-like protein